jgi:hypothetical protein
VLGLMGQLLRWFCREERREGSHPSGAGGDGWRWRRSYKMTSGGGRQQEERWLEPSDTWARGLKNGLLASFLPPIVFRL